MLAVSFFWCCWSINSDRTQILQAITNVLDDTPELVSKILLLRTHIWLIEHGEIQPLLTWNQCFFFFFLNSPLIEQYIVSIFWVHRMILEDELDNNYVFICWLSILLNWCMHLFFYWEDWVSQSQGDSMTGCKPAPWVIRPKFQFPKTGKVQNKPIPGRKKYVPSCKGQRIWKLVT